MADLTTYDYDIFLSHNHTDEEWTTKLAERLEQEDWQGRKIKVFFSPWDVRPGQSIPKEIERALSKSRKVGLIMSPDAIDSAWVELERLVTAYIAVSARDERLIPLYRRDCKIPALLQPVLYIDFRDDVAFEESYRTLLAVIKDEPLPRGSRQQIVPLTIPPRDVPRPPAVGFVQRRSRDGRNLIEWLREELAPQKAQLVALWGAGGVGKTTLAAEVARALADDFSQRVVWVSADTRTDLPFVTFLDEIARQLGNEELRKLAPDRKSEVVRTLVISQPTLIALDNFETISTAERQQCLEFLQHAQCSALITTRQKLEHARSIPITGMSPDEARNFLQVLIQQTQDPDIFAASYRERLIETAESNPLIMEWIVGQIDLANDPEEVLNDLTHGEGDAAHRVFDRSYNLPQLNDGGRAVLLALALFTPSAGRPTVAAVAGMDLGRERDKSRFKKAQETLASLWLIKKMDGGLRLAVSGLTRELTKAHLGTDLRAKTFHLRFVARFSRYGETHANQSSEDYNALALEKDNLMSATTVAFNLGDWRSVTRLAYPLENLLSVRGYWDDAVQIAGLALRIARSSYVEREIAAWSHNLAVMYQARGELGEARRLYQESLEIERKGGYQRAIGATLHQLGRLAEDLGDFEEARGFYAESLEINKALDNRLGIAGTTSQLGIVHSELGELSESKNKHEHSLAIRRKLGDQQGIAIDLYQLGRLAQKRGDFDDARWHYDKSLEISKKLGNQSFISNSLGALGSLAQDRGKFTEARQLYYESLEIAKKLGDQRGIAMILRQLGTLHLAEGEYEGAESLLQESLDTLRKLGVNQDYAECLESIGELRVAQSRLPEAEPLLVEALGIAEKLGIPFRTASVRRSLGLLSEKQGVKAKAAQLLREALTIFEKLHSPKAEDARRDLERVEGKTS